MAHIAPPYAGMKGLALRRLAFNLRIGWHLEGSPPDIIVGFHSDGFLSACRAAPFIASIKGVLAEESAQESGWPKAALYLMSLLERRNAPRMP